MTESLIPRGELDGEKVLEPEEILAEAEACAGCPIKRVCLVSGGHDSTVVAHRCRAAYDELAFIDTGTALPGVREFVEGFAAMLDKPLRVFEAGPAYAELVLGDRAWWDFYARERGGSEPIGHFIARTVPDRRIGDGNGNAPQGFPGPGRGGHRAAYARLKERAIEALVRTLKAEAGAARTDHVALLTGARRHESRRRSMTQGVDGWRRKGGQLWINPLNEWTNDGTRAYRLEHDLPESDVAALTHRSGECNCGAFMAKGEIDDARAWFPDWHRAVIAPLEDAARELRIPRSVWGERTDAARPGARGWDFAGTYDAQLALLAPESLATDAELCTTCELNFDEWAEVAHGR